MNGKIFAEINARGMSFSEIGAQYGKSRNAVAGAIWRFKNPKVKNGARKSRKPSNTERNRRITERNRRIIEMADDGVPYKDIAARFGMSYWAVAQVMSRRPESRATPTGVALRPDHQGAAS